MNTITSAYRNTSIAPAGPSATSMRSISATSRVDHLVLRSLPRWILLLLLLIVELLVITTRPDLYADLWPSAGWLGRIIFFPMRPAIISGCLVELFFSWPIARAEFLEALPASRITRSWLPWLTLHLVLASILFWVDTFWRASPFTSGAEAIGWLWLHRVLSVPVYATWAFAAMPPRFWHRWLSRSRKALVAGVVLGLGANILGTYTQSFYWSVQRLTFGLVALLLRVSGHVVVGHPQELTIGTPAFAVQIWPQCSGLEGVVLISCFAAGYLWFFRRELRFPQAFLLLPLGAIFSWLLNSVRIAALILIGAKSPYIAIHGFHSIAGWLFFNLVACGLVLTSRSFNVFANFKRHVDRCSAASPAAMYLLPFIALLAGTMLTQPFSRSFDFLYPLRVLLVIAALWPYRREIAKLGWNLSLYAIVLGAVVSLFWIVCADGDAVLDGASSTALANLPGYQSGIWLLFRIAGSIITVPIAEELAFRGYLIRKLVDRDFMSVAPGRFTWISFLGSSILFGGLHNQWVVGTLAGMIFAAALYRRGMVCDAVIAHGSANALLSLYVLTTRSWSVWT